MKEVSIHLNKATGQSPVSIEVSAGYERHITENIRKVVPVSYLQLNSCKGEYLEEEMKMIRFTLPLPDVSNDRLSQIAWFIGEWYSRMVPLVNTNLN